MSTLTSESSESKTPVASGGSLGAAMSLDIRPSGIAAAWMLARREWTRFFRQKNRVVSAVVQPLLFWLMFGAGMRGSFSWTTSGQEGFFEYFLPGTIGLIVLFTAIFATISVIEDRREGFMQGVLVSPVGRWPVLVGKVVGGGGIAWAQAVMFLGLVLLFGMASPGINTVYALVLLAVMSITLCSVGMIVAWPMTSTQGFHAVMMLFLMPMWLLSGAFFPIPAISDATSIGQSILHWIMRCNPLSYSMVELRRLLYPEVTLADNVWGPSSMITWTVSLLFMIGSLVLAGWLMRGSRRADLV
ncbi:ABC transporter permease [Rosistilla oblonga]|uniref:ABC transporter permease n=1 Tax=Rosistilla oblonga TaxID=2527990 RepID=UPI003A974D23